MTVRLSVTSIPNSLYDGEELYLSVMDIAGVPVTLCTDTVANLSDRRSEIIDAVDFLMSGF